MNESETWRQVIHGCVQLLVLSLVPILLSISLTGCTTKTPPRQPDSAICRDGNEEQLESWDNMVALARIDLDPFEVREGVLYAGGHLWRCKGAQ